MEALSDSEQNFETSSSDQERTVMNSVPEVKNEISEFHRLSEIKFQKSGP